MRTRALVVHACPRARGAARDGLAALGVLGGSAAKWTNVVRPIKRRQTDKQTKTHYSFIGIDISYLPSYLDIVLNLLCLLCLINADILVTMIYHIYRKDFSKISPAWKSCKFMCYAITSLLYIALTVTIWLCPDTPRGGTR